MISRLKQAVSAFCQAWGPRRYGHRGQVFACRICGHDRFKNGRLAYSQYHTYTCAECGLGEFFEKPLDLLPDHPGEPVR